MAYKLAGVNTIFNNRTLNLNANVTITSSGSINLTPFPSIVYSPAQGASLGFVSGGDNGPVEVNTIDRFSFASSSNAVDYGDLTQARRIHAGTSSLVSGYNAGGITGPTAVSTIDKFAFTSATNATSVGSLSQARSDVVGTESTAHGYTSGGASPPATSLSTIDRFPFSSDSNATNVGALSSVRRNTHLGVSSTNHGYTGGGLTTPTTLTDNTKIDKFPFAASTNATSIGDLDTPGNYMCGNSSDTRGFRTGALGARTIESWPFSSDTNATNVGSLLGDRGMAAASNSYEYGYIAGGNDAFPGSPTNNGTSIERFAFASIRTINSIGNLSQGRYFSAGQQA